MRTLYNHQITPQGDLPNLIRTKAADICRRRKDSAKNLREYQQKISERLNLYNVLIAELRKEIVVCSDSQKQDLTKLINKFESCIKEFESSLKDLTVRFEHSKIRILSFGFKSQGKSLFTKLYTGLVDDRIVAVKSENTNDDQTGATSVIIHDKAYSPESPKITVNFRPKDDVLELFNRALEVARSKANNSNGLPKPFKSYDEFILFMNSENKSKAYACVKSLNGKGEGFVDVKNLLCGFLNPNSDFSMAGERAIPNLPIEDLPMYNDMDMSLQKGHKQRYLTVRNIEIRLNLEREDMFQDFEICDTKGLSIAAGGELIEDELIEDINNADAIFSIARIGQSTNSEHFAQKLSGLSYEERTPHIRAINKRHFSIVNVHDNFAPSSVEAFEQDMQATELYNEMYIGMLRDGILNVIEKGQVKQYKVLSSAFANNALLRMMHSIVAVTESMDQELIQKCMASVDEINSDLKEIQASLSRIKAPAPVNLRKLIIERTHDKLTNLLAEISQYGIDNKIFEDKTQAIDEDLHEKNASKYMFAEDDDDSDTETSFIDANYSDNVSGQIVNTRPYQKPRQDYATLKRSNSTRTIYQALTGVSNDEISNLTLEEEIRQSVEYIVSRILVLDGNKRFIVKKSDEYPELIWGDGHPRGDEDHIGCILDEIMYRFNAIVDSNLEKSRILDQKATSDKLSEPYKKIWEALHIEECVGIPADFDAIRNVKENDREMPGFAPFYNVASVVDIEGERMDAQDLTSFNFIKEYMGESEYLSTPCSGLSIVNRETVIKALKKLLIKSDFLARVVNEIEQRDLSGENPLYRNLNRLKKVLEITNLASIIFPMYEEQIHTEKGIKKLIDWKLIPQDYESRIKLGTQWDAFEKSRNNWKATSELEKFHL